MASPFLTARAAVLVTELGATLIAGGCAHREAPTIDAGAPGFDGSAGAPEDAGVFRLDAASFVADCGGEVTPRIAMPPSDPCDPSAPTPRFGPVTRPLRLPEGGRAFAAGE